MADTATVVSGLLRHMLHRSNPAHVAQWPMALRTDIQKNQHRRVGAGARREVWGHPARRCAHELCKSPGRPLRVNMHASLKQDHIHFETRSRMRRAILGATGHQHTQHYPLAAMPHRVHSCPSQQDAREWLGRPTFGQCLEILECLPCRSIECRPAKLRSQEVQHVGSRVV